jgi:hypothetical protein
MALTEERLMRVEQESPPRAGTPEVPTVGELEAMLRSPRRIASMLRITHGVVLAAWLIALTGMLTFAPAPDDASLPLWSAVLSFAFGSALVATLVGLAARTPWGLRASAVTAGAGMAIAGACAGTGHHGGAWWAVEFAVFGGLFVLTTRASTRMGSTAR